MLAFRQQQSADSVGYLKQGEALKILVSYACDCHLIFGCAFLLSTAVFAESAYPVTYLKLELYDVDNDFCSRLA